MTDFNFLDNTLVRKFKYPFVHTPELRGDGFEASEGLLVQDTPPRRTHARQLSLSRFGGKRRIWLVGALVLAALLLLVRWADYSEYEEYEIEDKADLSRFTGELPWGQAHNVNGREVFWWEQFPLFLGYWAGRKTIVPLAKWRPEQTLKSIPIVREAKLSVQGIVPYPENGRVACYLDAQNKIAPPTVSAYVGRPQGMPEPLFGSSKELNFRQDVCYDRINRFAPYGAGYSQDQGGLGISMDGDTEGIEKINKIDYRDINFGEAQATCLHRNSKRKISKKAFVIRTWHDYDFTPHAVMMLRAIISELAIASGGEYTVHFLIDVHDESLDIWGSEAVYNTTLQSSLPPEFEGMGTLWNVALLKTIYPPPFGDTLNNFSGGKLVTAYRSLHWALQIFADKHLEYDYFWHWEMDLRVTGHYYELLDQITRWAERQDDEYIWERSSNFFIPALHDDSYAKYGSSIVKAMKKSRTSPVSGPQLDESKRVKIPTDTLQSPFTASGAKIVDFISFNPLFDPAKSHWAFKEDMTGYPFPPAPRPPTRASLITASRLSRRLLATMHQETLQRKHHMFPEMFPASIALQYGYKAVHAPLPLWMTRDWPAEHANEVFNNAKIGTQGYEMGMTAHGDGYFHGKDGSVFGPGEHVFRGASYYSNAAFAAGLWRTWLGRESDRAWWEEGEGRDRGRMCLPMMVVHPVKYE